MQKHSTSRICRLDEIDEKFLRFRLTPEQRAKVPRGAKITFRKSTQPFKDKGYKQFIARAEFNRLNPATGRSRAVTAASKLLGIIWDDDPEWLYETDKSKSSIAARRTAATAKRHAPSRDVATAVTSLFAEHVEYEDPEAVVIVKKVPVPLFLTVAVICSCRGITDATNVANYWNQNLDYLRKLYPNDDLNEISHDSVNRIYMSLTEKSVENMLQNFYEWTVAQIGLTREDGRRHIALDGQACRASRHFETDRRMMILNAVNVTAGRLCASHTMISTKSQEPKYAPELINELNVQGATVTLDALNTTPDIARAIVSSGGFYLLAVKRNQPKLFEAVRTAIDKALEGTEPKGFSGLKKAHGRNEKRTYVVIPASSLPEEFFKIWPGLRDGCLIKADTYSFRKRKDGEWELVHETRWFITCHPYGDGSIAEWLGCCVRGHWGIESFHWTMDMIWRQDQMQCMYPAYLRTRETLAKIAHNLLVLFRKIDQQERGLSKPRSESELSKEIGVTFENGLRWLQKVPYCNFSAA